MFAKFAATSTTARRLSVAGVVATALFGLSACATQSSAQNTASVKPAASGTAAAPATSAAIAYTAGMPVISNGTATVLVGGRPVTFPTSVTGAAWSPDGSRLAFLDADGNIATAHPDGSSLTVLTKAKPGVTRSNPTWVGGLIVFSEKDASGVSRMETVSAAGAATQPELLLTLGDSGSGNPSDTGNSAPSATPAASSQLDNFGEVAYVRALSDGPEVWIVDLNGREVGGGKVADGTDPAFSPDGSEIAYVTSKGYIDVISNGVDQGNQTPQQVTFSAADPSDLAWSADGTRIAFSTSAGIESVAAKVPAHATSNPVTPISSTPGTVSYLPATKNEIDQFTGTDPVGLSIAASQDRWPTESTYGQSQDKDPAMSATIGSTTALSTDLTLLPAAEYQGSGPLLLTDGSSLDPRVIAELQRVFGKLPAGEQSVPVYLLGGTSDVSASVESALQRLGYTTQRITSPTVPGTPVSANYPYAQVGPAQIHTVVIDSALPLDELIGTAYADYYSAPVVQVSGAELSAANLASLSQSSGAARPTALFGPASAFGSQFVTTVATQEDAPLGYTTVVNPANPVK